jgi:lysophospholipase L1-like esterase
MEWTAATALPIEGRGWDVAELGTPYDRFPCVAEGSVPENVWKLSLDSAGLVVRFSTDSPEIHARWTLRKASLAMSHMPATGVSGLDLYVHANGAWRWLAVGRPEALENEIVLCSKLSPGTHDFMLYLPLYNGVESLDVGVPVGSGSITPSSPRDASATPIVFYGTSITQGGCASRPGMSYPAILGRRLERPMINLGFSGSARMEPAVAETLASICPSPAAFVVDALPNMNGALVTERAAGFVHTIRAAHPTTPILLVEDRMYASVHTGLMHHQAEANRTNREALRQVYEALVAEGVKGLYYLEAGGQLGDDGEDTVDGSHPTDLGFVRQADAFEVVLRPLLGTAAAAL